VLQAASFTVERGLFAGVYGARRSGKSTLLRLAAGIELPDEGVVRIGGRDTAAMSNLQRERLLRHEVGLVCIDDWYPKRHESVLDYVAIALGGDGATLAQARQSAKRALAEVGLDRCAGDPASRLSVGERLRAILARALVRQPSLLLVDEPAVIPKLSDRDDLLKTLRAITAARRTTLLMASEDMAPLRGADFVISVGDGEINFTEPRLGTLVAFPGGRGPRSDDRQSRGELNDRQSGGEWDGRSGGSEWDDRQSGGEWDGRSGGSEWDNRQGGGEWDGHRGDADRFDGHLRRNDQDARDSQGERPSENEARMP
jgi:putative ABC transport system ATP-binding protein